MRLLTTAVVVLIGCGGEAPELVLDGEPHVRVEHLGEVNAPRARLSDGSEPEGLVWTVSEAKVASVEGGRVVASGEGTTQIVGSWQGQSVSWELEVNPEFILQFIRVPESVGVGETVKLEVIAELGGVATEATEIRFESSAPETLTVDRAGTVTGVAAGLAYISATGRGGRTMAEISVTEAP